MRACPARTRAPRRRRSPRRRLPDRRRAPRSAPRDTERSPRVVRRRGRPRPPSPRGMRIAPASSDAPRYARTSPPASPRTRAPRHGRLERGGRTARPERAARGARGGACTSGSCRPSAACRRARHTPRRSRRSRRPSPSPVGYAAPRPRVAGPTPGSWGSARRRPGTAPRRQSGGAAVRGVARRTTRRGSRCSTNGRGSPAGASSPSG